MAFIMQAKNYNFSMKCIPVASREDYFTVMVARTDRFLRNLRWKAFHFRNKDKPKQEKKETFGFKTSNTPPADKGLDGFENDLWEIIRNIEFNHKGRNPFQNMLKEKLKMEKECKDI